MPRAFTPAGLRLYDATVAPGVVVLLVVVTASVGL